MDVGALVKAAYLQSGASQQRSLPGLVLQEALARGKQDEDGERMHGLALPEWQVARGKAKLERCAGEEVFLPPTALLAVIMGDVRRNNMVLKKLRSDLESIGIPLGGWLIQYREHLYDDWGRETCEPVFTADCLREIVHGMWTLSLHVFGRSLFTYEDLASEIGEPDVMRVRIGVRRVAIQARDARRNAQAQTAADLRPIWAGQTEWRWNIRRRGSARDEGVGCDYATLASVLDAVLEAGA